MERFVSGQTITGADQFFSTVETLKTDQFSLSGEWRIEPERAVALAGAQLLLRFRGEKVHLVLAPSVDRVASRVRVFLDGQPVSESLAGRDVTDGAVEVTSERLYDLVDLRGVSGEHTLSLGFETPGVAAYAFTFS